MDTDGGYSGILSMPDPTPAPATLNAFGTGDAGPMGSGGIFAGGKTTIDPRFLAALTGSSGGLTSAGAQFLQQGQRQQQIQPMQMPNIQVQQPRAVAAPAFGSFFPGIANFMRRQ